MTPKTLNCTIRYRFSNGDVGHFQGPKCYRLSNSHRAAMADLMAACAYRNEPYDPTREIPSDKDEPWIVWYHLENRWTYRGCLIGQETMEGPILVGCNGGVNRYRRRVWRIVFPDRSWIRCGTKQQCIHYIDRGQGRWGVCPQASAIGVFRP